MMKIVIFDFDGTLANSFPWFIKRINQVAEIFRFHKVTPGEIENLRAMSVDDILKYLGISLFKLPFIILYLKWLMRKEASEITLFEGVSSLFKVLHQHQIRIIVLSSNARKNVQLILGDLEPMVMAYYCGAGMRAKETHFKKIKKHYPSAQIISVGDEPRDLLAAQKSLVNHLNVSWGYATKEAFAEQEMIDSWPELEVRILRYFDIKS